MLADRRAIDGSKDIALIVEEIQLATDVSARTHDVLEPNREKRH